MGKRGCVDVDEWLCKRCESLQGVPWKQRFLDKVVICKEIKYSKTYWNMCEQNSTFHGFCIQQVLEIGMAWLYWCLWKTCFMKYDLITLGFLLLFVWLYFMFTIVCKPLMKRMQAMRQSSSWTTLYVCTIGSSFVWLLGINLDASLSGEVSCRWPRSQISWISVFLWDTLPTGGDS